MAQVNAKCPNCKEEITIDSEKEANICLKCNEALITEKAIKLYNESDKNNVKGRVKKKRNVWKSLGKGLLMILECVGYLIYVLLLLWLFIDITDGFKKNKR